LPFAIVLLVFGPTAGVIVQKMGSLKPVILGTSVTAAGFVFLLAFHDDIFSVSAGLAILSTGLSLTNVGALNVTLLATPIQSTGMSLGTNTLLRIVGSSVGPALAGVYMQMYQSGIPVSGGITNYPSMQAYSSIFLTAVALSLASIALAIYLKKRVATLSIPNLS
jgi:MFS family permease